MYRPMQQIKLNNIEGSSIIKQVEKICMTGDFRSKALICRFLSYIVSEYLAGRGEKIKGYSIGVDVFNRDEDFDPGQDALVRIHAGRLRRLLEMYYLRDGKNDDIRIEIPKGGYIPIITYKKSDISPSDETALVEKQRSSISKPTVAVLPFRNLTGDHEQEYLALGFSEELSVELTRYEDILVFNSISIKASLPDIQGNVDLFRGKGIRFVIEGAVSQNNDQLKTLVRLTDLNEGRQLWAGRYQESLSANSLMEMQESIAKEVAGILGTEYGIILQKLTLDSQSNKPQQLNTYFAFLKFYYFQVLQTTEAAVQAFYALNQALEKEPESGIATAMLAIMHGNRYMQDIGNAKESFEIFGRLAEKAFTLDPNSTMVNVALAFKCFAYNEKERFFQIVDRGLAMNPNNSARLGALAFHLSLYGDWERGKKILDDLMNTSIGYPLYFHGSTMLYYYRQKEYQQALVEANRYAMPEIFWGFMLRAAVLGQLGRIEDARTEITNLKHLKRDFESKGRELISRYVKEGKLVDHILEGLRKAGMAL